MRLTEDDLKGLQGAADTLEEMQIDPASAKQTAYSLDKDIGYLALTEVLMRSRMEGPDPRQGDRLETEDCREHLQKTPEGDHIRPEAGVMLSRYQGLTVEGIGFANHEGRTAVSIGFNCGHVLVFVPTLTQLGANLTMMEAKRENMNWTGNAPGGDPRSEYPY